MDISTETASFMMSILTMSVILIIFPLMTWYIVKVYCKTCKDENDHTSLMDQVRKQQRGDK